MARAIFQQVSARAARRSTGLKTCGSKVKKASTEGPQSARLSALPPPTPRCRLGGCLSLERKAVKLETSVNFPSLLKGPPHQMTRQERNKRKPKRARESRLVEKVGGLGLLATATPPLLVSSVSVWVRPDSRLGTRLDLAFRLLYSSSSHDGPQRRLRAI